MVRANTEQLDKPWGQQGVRMVSGGQQSFQRLLPAVSEGREWMGSGQDRAERDHRVRTRVGVAGASEVATGQS